MLQRKLAVAVACAAVWLAACSKDGKPADGEPADPSEPPLYTPRPAAQVPQPEMLKLIPADTPFVMAGLRPLPDDAAARFGAVWAPIAKMAAEAEPPADPIARAVYDALGGDLSPDGLQRVGLALPPAYYAVYAIGPALALRVALKDPAKTEALFARLDAAGWGAAPRAVGGASLRTWPVEDVGLFAVGVAGGDLVMAVLPAGAADDVLPVLTGARRPARSLADTGALRDAIANYGLLGVAAGYIDARAVVRWALADGGLGAWGESADLSAECRKEIEAIAASVPRGVFGYTRADAHALDTLVVVELRDDLARDLAGWRADAPDMRALAHSSPLFAMGVAVDMNAVVQSMQSWARRVQAAPYQCADLAELNDAARQIAADTVPAEVAAIRGGAFAVQSLSLDGASPTGSGFAVVGTTAGDALLAKLATALPVLAGVDLPADGKPVEVQLGLPIPGKAHLARRGDWIGLSLGPGAVDRMVQFLGAKRRHDGPLVAFAYDYGRYMKLLSSAFAMGTPDPNVVRLVDRIAAAFGTIEVAVYADRAGVVAVSRMEMP
ncbi:MAG: hypothetical protein D6689_01530 [Deltaproteobacteria bacterium]|nr:MAG: hypothetical protein D6689_01530 [Deltaproteobacteria bacterium]